MAAGRPRKELDKKDFESLLIIQCSLEEVTAFLITSSEDVLRILLKDGAKGHMEKNLRMLRLKKELWAE